MASSHPLLWRWDGEAMVPRPAFVPEANRQFVVGQNYRLVEVEERSEVSHNHQFAWLNEAFNNLPESLAREFPTVEHLRKRALIATGFSTVQDYACGTPAEALRWAQYLRCEVDAYTLVEVSRTVVRVYRARSQKRGAMDKADFQASKTAMMDWVSRLLGVTVEDLKKAQAA